MTSRVRQIDVALEIGTKRVFACALDWPGWCRSGRTEDAALAALVAYAPRYCQVAAAAGWDFDVPTDVAQLRIAERLSGDATTDFGAPGGMPAADRDPPDSAAMDRLGALLEACWSAFDTAVDEATGRELAKGPRGGGRDLEKMIGHVMGGEGGYLSSLGARMRVPSDTDRASREAVRQAIRDGLARAAAGELPATGPRGGIRWPPRYFVRREAWHVLDHAWEIEDRLL